MTCLILQKGFVCIESDKSYSDLAAIIVFDKLQGYVRIPALIELPITRVVHPAYHALPNGGHPSFSPVGRRLLSCILVFATVGGH